MNNGVCDGGSQWESNGEGGQVDANLRSDETCRTYKTAKVERITYTGVQSETAVIDLGGGFSSLLDSADLPRLKGVSLSIKFSGRAGERKPYVRCDIAGRRGQARYAALHRLLLSASSSYFVDHRNGDGLDNRRANLRLCSETGNACNRRINSSKLLRYKGVAKVGIKYRARISTHGWQLSLGMFESAEAAAHAYDDAALKLHGEFARLNFPDTREVA